jgi:hypothetical protein
MAEAADGEHDSDEGAHGGEEMSSEGGNFPALNG